VKGYQYRKGDYVVLTDEDFRRANVKATQTIEIRAFVRPHEIPPQFFETPYYLAPDKHGAKVYALLRDALRKSERWAVGSVVIRTRAYACALLPHDDLLMLNTLRYADEILASDAIDAPSASVRKAGVSAREFELALKLVADMTEPWNPRRYKDTYRDDLMHRIEERVKKGETHALTPATRERAAPRSAEIIDLTALLKKSLAEKTSAPASSRAARRRTAEPRRSERRPRTRRRA
jgi:DNA end-binding protein Ku